MDILSGREIILEFRGGGGGTQICAVDCASGVEVFVITPANAARIDQETLALRKLSKALLDQGIIKPPPISQENSGPKFGKPLPSKRGIIV